MLSNLFKSDPLTFDPRRFANLLHAITPDIQRIVQTRKPDEMLVILMPYEILVQDIPQGHKIPVELEVMCRNIDEMLSLFRKAEKYNEIVKAIEFSRMNEWVPCVFQMKAENRCHYMFMPYGDNKPTPFNLSPGGSA